MGQLEILRRVANSPMQRMQRSRPIRLKHRVADLTLYFMLLPAIRNPAAQFATREDHAADHLVRYASTTRSRPKLAAATNLANAYSRRHDADNSAALNSGPRRERRDDADDGSFSRGALRSRDLLVAMRPGYPGLALLQR